MGLLEKYWNEAAWGTVFLAVQAGSEIANRTKFCSGCCVGVLRLLAGRSVLFLPAFNLTASPQVEPQRLAILKDTGIRRRRLVRIYGTSGVLWGLTKIRISSCCGFRSGFASMALCPV